MQRERLDGKIWKKMTVAAAGGPHHIRQEFYTLSFQAKRGISNASPTKIFLEKEGLRSLSSLGMIGPC
jgi:hypothetical protein